MGISVTLQNTHILDEKIHKKRKRTKRNEFEQNSIFYTKRWLVGVDCCCCRCCCCCCCFSHIKHFVLSPRSVGRKKLVYSVCFWSIGDVSLSEQKIRVSEHSTKFVRHGYHEHKNKTKRRKSEFWVFSRRECRKQPAGELLSWTFRYYNRQYWQKMQEIVQQGLLCVSWA